VLPDPPAGHANGAHPGTEQELGGAAAPEQRSAAPSR
jgi:hypothetical protein